MRADKTIRLERQAGQVDLAIARRDARSEQSLAAETSYVLFSAIELEDLHERPSAERVVGRRAVIISLGGAPCRDESRDDARANRAPESFMQGLVFTRKGLPLAR